ncbi:MAG: Mrp/NBP35 family ATP-binding protein [Alphaproteobacteria bacterium]
MPKTILPAFAKVLRHIKTPDGKDLLTSGLIINSQIQDGVAQIILDIPDGKQTSLANYQTLKTTIEKKLNTINGVKKSMVIMTLTRDDKTIKTASPQNPFAEQKPIPKVKKIIAVASGKGGVGKSTIAFNLALALTALGKKIALLDADIYGPSLPTLAGIAHKKPDSDKNNMMIPLTAFDMEINSIGFLLEDNQPTIWRGPMVMSALTQLLFQTSWGSVLGERDIMVVDLPPGTGDAQLTLIQRIVLSGAVVVSTPQDLALLDAKKAIAMFKKLNIPLLGLVENMAYFLCDSCGKEHDIFSRGGAKAEAMQESIAFLGELPLTKNLRVACDNGVNLIKKNETEGHIFLSIAKKIMAELS